MIRIITALVAMGYVLSGTNGGRGGLPEVRLWLPESLTAKMAQGEHSWTYPKSPMPDNMHYSGWRFWQFGLSDALLQLISDQATDPSHSSPRLGRYFARVDSSALTGWNSQPGPLKALEADIRDTTAVTESCRADHYVTYGLSNELFFNGNAKFQLSIDKAHNVSVKALSSTLPPSATENLRNGLESLSGHPLLSFPDDPSAPETVAVIAEFSILRKPGVLNPPQDRSGDGLQKRLAEVESSFRNGNLNSAIDQASSLLNVPDSSFFESNFVAREAKKDLAIFQLKAGHPDESTKLIRELSMSFQNDMHIDPKFETQPAEVLATVPSMLKDQFAKVIDRLGESADTKVKIESIISSIYPQDYVGQLKTYFSHLKTAMNQLAPLQRIAESEQLKYDDPLASLDDDKDAPKLNHSNLQRIGKSLDALATEARQLPVGDLQAASGLYRLSLAANNAKDYQQAEMFAQQGLAQVKAMEPNAALPGSLEITLAYALIKQGKLEAFDSLKNDLLRRLGDNEANLVTLARFTTLRGDKSGAVSIYARVLDNRIHKGMLAPPDWMPIYDYLLKEVGDQSKQ
jgi:hypothetical protein